MNVLIVADSYTHLYMDGVEVTKDTDLVGGMSVDGSLCLGVGKILDATIFFSCLIENVCTYKRVMRIEEVAELVHKGTLGVETRTYGDPCCNSLIYLKG